MFIIVDNDENAAFENGGFTRVFMVHNEYLDKHLNFMKERFGVNFVIKEVDFTFVNPFNSEVHCPNCWVTKVINPIFKNGLCLEHFLTRNLRYDKLLDKVKVYFDWDKFVELSYNEFYFLEKICLLLGTELEKLNEPSD